MSVAIADFWRLLAESRLLTSEQVQQLAGEFGQGRAEKGGADARALAQWLVRRNVVSPYQARILLAGHAGPFVYGAYVVYDRVESGRLAGQFRAVHAPTRHPVLLEFLTGPTAADPQSWALAAGNVLAASAIVSPHVQRWFEPVDLQAFKFFVSEDLRGNTLDERLAKGRLPPAEACRIVRQVAVGLSQMHASGRVHGDVRLANILLEVGRGPAPTAKLLYSAWQSPGPFDFAQQQPGGRLAAVADFLAPELAHPGRSADALADIYALGCILYALLSGSPPFAGGSVQQKLARHASEPIRPLEPLGVPPPLAQAVAYMMAKNPAVRFQSAVQVAEQLAAFVEPTALQPPPPAAVPTLAAYEAHLQLHRRAPAPGPSLAAAVAAPPSPSVISAPTFQTDARQFAAAAPAATPAAPQPQPAIQLNVPAKKRSTLSAEEVLRRRAAQKKRNLIIGAAAAAVLAVASIVAANVVGLSGLERMLGAAPSTSEGESEGPSPIERPRESESQPRMVTTGGAANAPEDGSSAGSGTSATAGSAVQEVVADDGATLWAAPTAGAPVEFHCVPPEGQVFLILRPADMLASDEGAKVLQALGPGFEKQRAAWEAASGFPLEQIEQLIVTLHNNDAQFPRTSFVVKTKEPLTSEALLARWGNPAPAQQMSQTYYTGGSWSYYIPASDQVERTFAMGEARDIQEVAANAGKPFVLFRDIERLRLKTDGQRHFTLLLFPQFLFNDDGEPLFAGERQKVRQPLAWFLGDNLQAASASGHVGELLYLELRMVGTLDNEPYKLAEALRERLNEVPRSLEDYFVTLTPPPYWKKLAFRYPGMVSELHRQTRIGVEEGQAVVNAVLPPAAAHNLVLGGELLLATAPGQAAVVAAPPVSAGPKTIEEALQLKTSYSFDSQSLEFAMQGLAADVKDQARGLAFDIKIIGADLEKDGITRNQTIRDFKQDNQTVADILTALVMKANPITTVKEPNEPDQKLIWVVGPDPDDSGKQIVLITTRAAAASKGYKLPAVFVK